jgi:hypothetical protein
MACNITQAIPLDCMSALGGISSIYVYAEGANIPFDIQAVVAGEVTLANGTGGPFYQYKFAKDTAKLTETATISNANGTVFYTTELSINISKRETFKRNEFLLLAKNREIRVIAKDNMGQYWLMGNARGAVLSTMVGEGGQAIGDMNGYTFTFQSMEADPMPALSTTSANALDSIAPASTAVVGGFSFETAL